MMFQISELWGADLETSNKLVISRKVKKTLLKQNRMKSLWILLTTYNLSWEK